MKFSVATELSRPYSAFSGRLQECSLSSPGRLASFRHAAPPRSIQWLHCDTSDVLAESISERSNHLPRGGGLLTAIAAASCFVPARRTTQVNPFATLRAE